MLLALRFVAANPGCTKFACARYIGRGLVDPAHSPGALYETIDRGILHGWIGAKRRDPWARAYALTLTTSGAALLVSTDARVASGPANSAKSAEDLRQVEYCLFVPKKNEEEPEKP